MKVEELGDGSLVITYDSRSLTRLMLGATVLFLCVAGYDSFIGTRGTDRLIGLLGAAATCLAIGILFLETATFEFARPTHIITWHRRWALRQRSGTIPFAAIQSVQVERPLGDDGAPSRRIVLRTTDGVGIPITVGYQSDINGTVLQIADRIRALLGHHVEETRAQDVKVLIAAGKKIEAIRVLREQEGLSLTAAKQRVDDMSR